MTTSPTSYLQTLTNDDAIAFVASLQQVKDYLSQELQWMDEQVQQKTVQLQGLETLLSEAAMLGLVADSTSEPALAVAAPGVTAVVANGSVPPDEVTEPLATTIAALPVETPSMQQRDQQGAGQAKTRRGSQTSGTTKNSTAKAKQSNASTPAARKAQRGTVGLQQFLQHQWRDKALTESVINILNHASAPLTADDIMAELYDGLPKEDYQRAKHSLANVLSVGRSKGIWKSTGRGHYAGNTVTIVP